METIVFLDRDTLDAELRPPSFEHRWVDYGATGEAEVFERLRDATVAVVNKVPLRAEVLSRLPRLKLIAVAATGTDNVDTAFCRERGIEVSNVRGYAVLTVPEHVLMLTLALRRSLPAYAGDVRGGAWQRAGQFCLLTHPIRDLRGSTFGVVGYGTLGRATAELMRAVGAVVLVAEHKGAREVREGRASFEEVLKRSDAVSLHVSLKDETRGLVGREELGLMKPTSILINCARGGVVEEAALAEALREGTIAGAGVDVLSAEPPRDSNPLLAPDLQPKLVVTPHVAWASREAMQTLADQLVANIEAHVAERRKS
ncbi:MAG TPA: D-2-hydroxyacid dehydrogenase [Pyrinomonadaceae bacterium]|nr:D-2-hydroxyacid dehydrogenase [Pyrinomonadaceae bacterium]